MFKVLHVGGDDSSCAAVTAVIEGKRNCTLEYVDNVTAGKHRVMQSGISLAIVHVPVGGEMDIVEKGADFLTETAIAGRQVPTIMIMEEPDVDLILRFLQLGAVECLCRPLSVSRLSLLIDIITASSLRQNRTTETITEAAGENFFYQSPTMSNLLDEVRLVARLETTVLLSGETGTGKSSLARLIHSCSPHRHSPFVTVNCGTLTASLIESELFGHKRGAFTGADRDHVGKFAHVGRGTLFLDDVDTLPLDVQTKFLRAIEDRMFEAVGSDETQRLEARLIAATNKDLESEVAKGRFRSDLFYRLNVASFRLPGLRERQDEIGLLVRHFASTLALEHGIRKPRFSALATAALRHYDWPGNIRELRNTIEHCLIVSSGTEVELKHLPQCLQRSVPPTAFQESAKTKCEVSSLKEVKLCAERDHLVAELHRNENNRSRTAEDLGISRTALYKQLRKHNLK